jgi:hypothetical protein
MFLKESTKPAIVAEAISYEGLAYGILDAKTYVMESHADLLEMENQMIIKEHFSIIKEDASILSEASFEWAQKILDKIKEWVAKAKEWLVSLYKKAEAKAKDVEAKLKQMAADVKQAIERHKAAANVEVEGIDVKKAYDELNELFKKSEASDTAPIPSWSISSVGKKQYKAMDIVGLYGLVALLTGSLVKLATLQSVAVAKAQQIEGKLSSVVSTLRSKQGESESPEYKKLEEQMAELQKEYQVQVRKSNLYLSWLAKLNTVASETAKIGGELRHASVKVTVVDKEKVVNA